MTRRLTTSGDAIKQSKTYTQTNVVNGFAVELKNNLCLAFLYANQLARAQQCLEDLVPMASKIGSSEQEATASNNYGGLLYSQRRVPQALEAFDRALRLYEKENDSSVLQSAYNNVCTLLQRDGPNKESSSLLHAC